MRRITVEELYNAPAEKVWKAITELELMKKWFFENIPDFRAEVGFKTQFTVDTGQREFIHLWEIIEVIPNRKIVYNWQYEKHEGDSNVEFELFEKGNGTQIRVTTVILKEFPDDIPEFKDESCRAGWEYFIKSQLKQFLGES